MGKATGGRSDPESQPDLTLLHGILQSTTQNTLFLGGAQTVLQETPGATEQTSKRNEIRPCVLSSHAGMNQKSITEGFFGGRWKCSKLDLGKECHSSLSTLDTETRLPRNS